MAGKVHINSKGEPAPCRATKRQCRFGQHFESIEAAHKYLEGKEAQEHQDSLKSVKKPHRTVFLDGKIEYHSENGDFHRGNSPALIRPDGTREYWENNKLIRRESDVRILDEDTISKKWPHEGHSAPVKDTDDFNKPVHKLDHIFPKDVYRFPYGAQYPETCEQIQKARENPDALLIIYRAVPKGVSTIKPGIGVTLSEGYQHMKSNIDGEGVVLAAVVPAKAIYTNADSLEEWGFSGDREL